MKKNYKKHNVYDNINIKKKKIQTLSNFMAKKAVGIIKKSPVVYYLSILP